MVLMNCYEKRNLIVHICSDKHRRLTARGPRLSSQSHGLQATLKLLAVVNVRVKC